MKVEITARHFTQSDQLKAMVYDKLKKVEKFNSGIINCRVVLTKEANLEDVEIVINGKGYHFVANKYSTTFEKSLISAIDKITIQVKKQHEKMLEH